MITATYDGKTLRIYKNAKLIKSGETDFDNAAPMVRLAPPGPPGGHRDSRENWRDLQYGRGSLIRKAWNS